MSNVEIISEDEISKLRIAHSIMASCANLQEPSVRLTCLSLAVARHNAQDGNNWDVLETAEKYYQWVTAKTADNQPQTKD